MRALLLAILFAASTAALASYTCTYHTVTHPSGTVMKCGKCAHKMEDNTIITCTTCCAPGGCSTQCG